MPFDDALIGNGNDFDPRTAMESLIRQQSAEPLPDTLDPRMLNTRLARKLNQSAPAPEPVDLKPAAQPEPDFSSQAVEPTTPNANLDFSDQAVPPAVVNPAVAPAPGISSTVGTYATEFGKGVAEGAKNMGASALKGAAAVGIPTQAPTEMLDELGKAKDMTASQRAKLMGRVLREISDRGLQMDYNAALRRVSQGGDAAKEIEQLRPKFEANNKSATEPVTDKKLYQAGQAVEDFGKETLAPAPGFEGSWTRDIGSGAGSMAAGIAASMVPGIGPTVAGSLFTAAGMGEAAEKAVKGGADNDQIRRATMLGGVAGATDLVDALIPMLGSTGKALGFLKRVGLAAVKGAIMEGGQEGVQQLMQNAIAKGIYKPDQDMFEDVPRSMAIAAILGGAGGGISGAASRGRDGGSPGLPPPGGTQQPGAGPTDGGPSSPEDIADFVRKAREGAPEQPQPEGPMSEAERQRAYTASRESHGGASEADILKAAGLDPTTMDEQERIDAVIKATKKADATGNADGTAGAQPGASEPQEDEGSHLRYAVLREYGYSDTDIDEMSSRQRKREYMDAVAEGIEPGKAMSKHPKRAPKATTKSDVGAEPVTDVTRDDVTVTPAPQPTDTGQNVPESRATLKAQQNQLIKGERVAQMFPKGTKEMPLPPGMERVETPRGIFHFDPKKADAASITKASSEGRENELLGLGSFTKEDIAARAGEPNVTVVERTPDGTEVRAAVGTPSTAEQQRDELEKGKSPGNTVSIETPEQTLDGRRGSGKRDEPIEVRTARDVDAIGKVATNEHTHAQGEANNRQLGHGTWNDLPISIEVAKGGTRKMVNPETGEGVDVTHGGAAYGYFLGTKGADGMHVDLYLGDDPGSSTVYVIDEIDRKTGKYRQAKVMGGFASERDAFAAYVQTSTKGPETVGAITAMSVPDLKAWLSEGDTTKALKPTSPGPDKTEEAGTALSTGTAAETEPKETPNASLGGDGGVRPEATTSAERGGSSAPAKKAVDEPLSLLQFVASRGGLRPDPELNAIGLAGDHRVQIPGRKGFFGVTKATGDSLDNMREAAEEAGYFRGEGNKTSTVRDFLDALDIEMRGGQHRAEGEEGKQSKKQRTSQAESSAAARDKAIAENIEAIQAEYTELPEGLAEQAATIMADEMLDLDSAVEMAAVRAVNEDADYEITENDITATYGEGAIDALQSRAASADGGDATPAVGQEQRPGESEKAEGDGASDARAGAESREAEVAPTDENGAPLAIGDRVTANAVGGHDIQGNITRFVKNYPEGAPDAEIQGDPTPAQGRMKAREGGLSIHRLDRIAKVEPTTEPGPDGGKQTVLPGAERIGQGEQAQRRADQGLKPKVPQRPADDGLFGDSMNQVELALGPVADKVAPVDIARAAEIMGDNPGMDPATAFGQAVVVNAVEQGFITEQEAVEAYGEEVRPTLEAASAGAHQRGSDLEPESLVAGEVAGSDAAKAGVVPSGGENLDGQLDDTAGNQPDAAGDAGSAASPGKPLDKIFINVKVDVIGGEENLTVRMMASEALDIVDKRVSGLRDLRACLK